MARIRPAIAPSIVRFTEPREIAVRVAAPSPAAAMRLAARTWRDGKVREAFAIDRRRIDKTGARITRIRIKD